jgi:hypothetical protein
MYVCQLYPAIIKIQLRIVDETSQQKEWYKGTVMSVISGNDGKLNAVYEVLYDGDDDAYVIDHLIQDFHAGSVVFCDL